MVTAGVDSVTFISRKENIASSLAKDLGNDSAQTTAGPAVGARNHSRTSVGTSWNRASA